MSFSDLIRWLSADWTHAVTAAGLLALGYALAWAAIRASYERVVGKPMPRTRFVLVLDVLADLAVNVPGALNRLLRSTGRDPLFLPAPPAARRRPVWALRAVGTGHRRGARDPRRRGARRRHRVPAGARGRARHAVPPRGLRADVPAVPRRRPRGVLGDGPVVACDAAAGRRHAPAVRGRV
jgi:hypothetical protein